MRALSDKHTLMAWPTPTEDSGLSVSLRVFLGSGNNARAMRRRVIDVIVAIANPSLYSIDIANAGTSRRRFSINKGTRQALYLLEKRHAA